MARCCVSTPTRQQSAGATATAASKHVRPRASFSMFSALRSRGESAAPSTRRRFAEADDASASSSAILDTDEQENVVQSLERQASNAAKTWRVAFGVAASLGSLFFARLAALATALDHAATRDVAWSQPVHVHAYHTFASLSACVSPGRRHRRRARRRGGGDDAPAARPFAWTQTRGRANVSSPRSTTREERRVRLRVCSRRVRRARAGRSRSLRRAHGGRRVAFVSWIRRNPGSRRSRRSARRRASRSTTRWNARSAKPGRCGDTCTSTNGRRRGLVVTVVVVLQSRYASLDSIHGPARSRIDRLVDVPHALLRARGCSAPRRRSPCPSSAPAGTRTSPQGGSPDRRARAEAAHPRHADSGAAHLLHHPQIVPYSPGRSSAPASPGSAASRACRGWPRPRAQRGVTVQHLPGTAGRSPSASSGPSPGWRAAPPSATASGREEPLEGGHFHWHADLPRPASRPRARGLASRDRRLRGAPLGRRAAPGGPRRAPRVGGAPVSSYPSRSRTRLPPGWPRTSPAGLSAAFVDGFVDVRAIPRPSAARIGSHTPRQHPRC